MFTGIIKSIGTLTKKESSPAGMRFWVEASSLPHFPNIDDSVSVNGVCQTVTAIQKTQLGFDAIHVTLEKTNLGRLEIGSKVNLETALRPIDPMGGHFVQGHVNGVGSIEKINERGENWEVWYKIPSDLMKYCVLEGSITIDGISLTIARLENAKSLLCTSIIPHTWNNTILGTKKVHDEVNIEVDMMAKHIYNFLQPHLAAGSITKEKLQDLGFS